MKVNFKIILAFVMLSGMLFTSCNSESDKSGSTTVTDSSTMIKKDTAMSSMATPPDTSSASSSGNATTSKSNAASTSGSKKKGKVSTMMMTAPEKPAGPMNTDAQGFYNSVETLPAYPGGQAALDKFINDNVEYPTEAINNNKEGTVIVSFGIDENGKVMNAKIASNPMVGDGLETEALRVINKMPAWTPGMVKGKKVRSHYSLPIRFQLAE